MKLTISSQSQFGVHICQYLYDMDSNFAKENQSLPLQDIVAHILYATNRIRMEMSQSQPKQLLGLQTL